jgi:two-component system, NarL family, response regulator YdfI
VSRTVLIVDDNAIIRRMLRDSIEDNREWQVCGEAENGRIAVERVKELHPDIVILDLQMPVMNGLDAARQIAILAPSTVVVMFTTYCSQQLSKDAETVGIKTVLSKSDTRAIDRLLAAMRNACVPSKPRVGRLPSMFELKG